MELTLGHGWWVRNLSVPMRGRRNQTQTISQEVTERTEKTHEEEAPLHSLRFLL
jgi:hypothetical protein